ncbi:MAG: carboxypeptidase regulatory-like domain-containing protein, partial [Acidobacteria bacterium]|nr:carboxypeptidase regulatory-like domain-containing protein [Acidobacteriota bacterium]
MKMTQRWLSVLLTLVLLAGFGLVAAQEVPATTTGTMVGMITDPQQLPLPGATVVVRSVSAGSAEKPFEQAAMTGADGKYKITGLPPATDYELQVSFPGGGFSAVMQERIVIRADRVTAESVQLFENIVEKVVVSAKQHDRRIVDLAEVGQVTEFSAEFIEGLPLLGRNYQDILNLAAGVSDSDNDGNPNVLGARAENFKAIIDGVSNQDVLGGTFASNLNNDTIEAVEVIQTGGDASLGRASGSFAR